MFSALAKNFYDTKADFCVWECSHGNTEFFEEVVEFNFTRPKYKGDVILRPQNIKGIKRKSVSVLLSILRDFVQIKEEIYSNFRKLLGDIFFRRSSIIISLNIHSVIHHFW